MNQSRSAPSPSRAFPSIPARGTLVHRRLVPALLGARLPDTPSFWTSPSEWSEEHGQIIGVLQGVS